MSTSNMTDCRRCSNGNDLPLLFGYSLFACQWCATHFCSFFALKTRRLTHLPAAIRCEDESGHLRTHPATHLLLPIDCAINYGLIAKMGSSCPLQIELLLIMCTLGRSCRNFLTMHKQFAMFTRLGPPTKQSALTRFQA